MTIKTVSSVIDDINEWESPRGGYVYYVTAMFTDESVGSVGKKTKADAELVQRQLQDAIGEPLEFALEDGGISQGGRQKWKIRDFAAPGVQGDGGTSAPAGAAPSRGRPPEHDVEASIRAAVALKAAANFCGPRETYRLPEVIEMAESFDAWLAKKASEPASSAYGESDSGIVSVERNHTADAGSETMPGGIESTTGSRSSQDGPSAGGFSGPPFQSPAVDAGLVDSGDGEAPESTPHIHDYQLRQGVRGFLVCECGKTTKRATA